MKDVYAAITRRIMDALAQGVVPWQRPWDAQQGRPRNLVTDKPYRGINLWLLVMAGGSPFWLTYKQAQRIGGQVRKGEHGVEVVVWKWVKKTVEPPAPAEGEPAEPVRTKRYAMLRSYTVFNATQCELPEDWQERAEVAAPALAEADKIAACEQIVATMPSRPEIVHAGVKAMYQPGPDRVTMPAPQRFAVPERYYSTMFHELAHSTGHPRRLDRATLVDMVAFGNTNYSKEELCAEMGAVYLCGVAGIKNRTCDHSAAYIQGWLSTLQDDKRLLISAAAQAQRAADFILGEQAALPED